jgi:hypothetical protein
MARRELEEVAVHRGALPAATAEIVPSQIDLTVVKRIRLVNRSKTCSAKVTMFVVQGTDTDEAGGQYLFNDVEIEKGGWLEWWGWHVLARDTEGSGLFEQVYARTTGQVDCLMDGALLEEL